MTTVTDDDYGYNLRRYPGQRLTLPDQRPPGRTLPGARNLPPPREVHGKWRRLAACHGMPTDLWFIEGAPTAESLATQRQAQAVCADCAVAIDCAAEAVMRNEQYGVWGGLTPKPLGRLRSATNRPGGWRIAAPTVGSATCGTAA